MTRSGWSAVALATAFFIVQACGDGFTGRISTPGAMPNPEQGTASAAGGDAAGGGAGGGVPAGGGGGFEAGTPDSGSDAGWPDYDYDDGGVFWDGGAPVVLMGWHWNQGLAVFRGQNGQRVQAHCIPNGSDFAVWGSNPYTDDSPVCTAGAHMGVVGRDAGGWVTVEIRPAQRSFTGATRNAVTSFSWGPFPGSYQFVEPQPPPPP